MGAMLSLMVHSCIDENLEPAPGHTFHVEGHRLRIAYFPDLVSDGLNRVLARDHPAIGCVVTAALVDVPVLRYFGKQLDAPSEQRAIKLLCAFRIVRWDFKPDDARSDLVFLYGLRSGFRFCAHPVLLVG